MLPRTRSRRRRVYARGPSPASARWPSIGVFVIAPYALLAMLLAIFPLPTGSFTPAGHLSGAPITPSAVTAHDLILNGVDPTELSLNWTPESPPCMVYHVEYSNTSSAGPWTLAKGDTVLSGNSSYVFSQIPGTTTWWHVTYERGTFHPRTECEGYELDNVSTVLQVTQPDASTLTGTEPTSSTIQLDWNNLAMYGGHVAFGSYGVYESINGTAFVPVALLTNESNRSYALTDILPRTPYSFYVSTTDLCPGCPGGSDPSSSVSNVKSFGPPSPLRAVVGVNRISADVGQPLAFTCLPEGGAFSPTYTYSWTFGDGAGAANQTPSHSYSSAGRFPAVCAVANATGTRATSSVNVTISSDPQVTSSGSPPSRTEVGEAVSFSMALTGGSGRNMVEWSGLPVGCGSVNGLNLTCVPSGAGLFNLTVAVTDSNLFTAVTHLPAWSVALGPTIVTFNVASTNLTLGQHLLLTVVATGGTAPLSYTYSGLPLGCAAPNAPRVDCVPNQTGQITVGVTVTDAVGVSTRSTVIVAIHAVATPTNKSASILEWVGVGLAAAMVALVAILLLVARRKGNLSGPLYPSVPGTPASSSVPPAGMGLRNSDAIPVPLPVGLPTEALAASSPPPEPRWLTETRRLLQQGENSEAVCWAFESVLAELSAKSPTPIPSSTTYRDFVVAGFGGELGQLPDLLDRLYRMYEPVRYGMEPPPDSHDLLQLLVQIIERPPFRDRLNPTAGTPTEVAPREVPVP